MENYSNKCLRLAHSCLDSLDPLLVGILDGNVVSEEIFRKQLDSIDAYAEALNVRERDSKLMRDFTQRVEQLRFMLETLDEQGHSNLLVAKIIRALCGNVVNNYNLGYVDMTEEEFYTVLRYIREIDNEEENMRNTLLGELQDLGYRAGLFIPLNEGGFVILKDVVEGMIANINNNQTIEYLNGIIRRCNGLVKYEGIETLDEGVKEELRSITTSVRKLVENEKEKMLCLFGTPIFK